MIGRLIQKAHWVPKSDSADGPQAIIRTLVNSWWKTLGALEPAIALSCFAIMKAER